MLVTVNIPPTEEEVEFLKFLLSKKDTTHETSDALNPINIIPQEVIFTQEKEKEKENEVTMENILSNLNLKYDPSSHGCKSRIISYTNLPVWFDRLGANLFEKDISAILTAWPTDEKKWHQKIIDEICAFTFIYRDCKIDFKRLADRLKKKFTNRSDLETASDFESTITDIPGEATLKRYDSKMNEKNRLPQNKLYENFYNGENHE